MMTMVLWYLVVVSIVWNSVCSDLVVVSDGLGWLF